MSQSADPAATGGSHLRRRAAAASRSATVGGSPNSPIDTTSGAALELHDVAVEIDERLLARLHADRAGGAHLAELRGAETMRDDLALLELGDVRRRELELLERGGASAGGTSAPGPLPRRRRTKQTRTATAEQRSHGFCAGRRVPGAVSAALRLKSRSSGAQSGSIGASMTRWRSCRASAVLCWAVSDSARNSSAVMLVGNSFERPAEVLVRLRRGCRQRAVARRSTTARARSRRTPAPTRGRSP